MSSEFVLFVLGKPGIRMICWLQHNQKKMAQVTITIPDSLEEYLRDVAEEEGMKFSSLAALCVQFGFSEYVERLNKYQVYKKLKSRLPQKGKPEAAKDEEMTD